MANSENKPKLNLLEQSNEFKIYSVTANAGAHMPNHISTKEAVVIVEEGDGTLNIKGNQKELKKGDFAVIPGGEVHSLDINSDFKAKITMASDSEIKFK